MQPMTDRARFLATMFYQQRDRCPIYDFGFWDETIVEWHKQGLPEEVTGGHDTTKTNEYFGMDTYWGGVCCGVDLHPVFESRVIEDRGDHELVLQSDGVTVLRKKYMGSIPEHHGHTLVDRDSWKKHYLPRLNPDTPSRYPDWQHARKVWNDPHYDKVHLAWCGSLYGRLRDWMGMEAISYLVYDDPALFEEMVETMCNLAVVCYTRAFEHGARYDAIAMWEDMCYNAGPLLTPELFKRYLVPRYKRITDLFRKHGCTLGWIDCDGKIDDLIPMWLDAGINIMFPVEVGVWNADPVAYRKQFGKDLRMMGGFDKHLLAKGKGEIEKEVHRLTPLVEEGGFVPFCDHRVPPDVPLENYIHYLELARKHWGKGVNLRPMHKPAPVTI